MPSSGIELGVKYLMKTAFFPFIPKQIRIAIESEQVTEASLIVPFRFAKGRYKLGGG